MIVLAALVIMFASSHLSWGAINTKNQPSFKLGVYFVCDSSFLESRNKHPAPVSTVEYYLNVMLRTAELYFRDLECPNVELYLVGLRNTTKEEEDIFEVTEILRPNIRRIDGPHTLALFQEWVQNHTEFNESDIVFLLTSKTVVDHIGSFIFGLDRGVSYLDGICSNLRVGIVQDLFGRVFFGIRVLAQQIFHILGAPWDEGHQAPECLDTEGHLMSARFEGAKHPTLSNCTKNYLLQKYYDNLHTNSCWMDMPYPITPRTKDLSAQYFETENYCKARFSDYPEADFCPSNLTAKQKPPICFTACCKNRTTVVPFNVQLPDGTNCSEGKICLFGKCVQA